MIRPKLYPGHRHQWTDADLVTDMVRCTVCGFQAPRNAAGPDGRMDESVRTNSIPANRTNPEQETA